MVAAVRQQAPQKTVVVAMVHVSLRRWDTEILGALSQLSAITGSPILTFAVREDNRCPVGASLIYMDPDCVAQCIVLHHKIDWEFCHRRVQSLPGCNLQGVQEITHKPKI